MNRREAIAALVVLPQVTRITVADVKVADVIVVECDGHITADTAARIRATMKDIWPDNKIVVCEAGVRIKVVGG